MNIMRPRFVRGLNNIKATAMKLPPRKWIYFLSILLKLNCLRLCKSTGCIHNLPRNWNGKRKVIANWQQRNVSNVHFAYWSHCSLDNVVAVLIVLLVATQSSVLTCFLQFLSNFYEDSYYYVESNKNKDF